jgi:hypothetical protein
MPCFLIAKRPISPLFKGLYWSLVVGVASARCATSLASKTENAEPALNYLLSDAQEFPFRDGSASAR